MTKKVIYFVTYTFLRRVSACERVCAAWDAAKLLIHIRVCSWKINFFPRCDQNSTFAWRNMPRTAKRLLIFPFFSIKEQHLICNCSLLASVTCEMMQAFTRYNRIRSNLINNNQVGGNSWKVALLLLHYCLLIEKYSFNQKLAQVSIKNSIASWMMRTELLPTSSRFSPVNCSDAERRRISVSAMSTKMKMANSELRSTLRCALRKSSAN